MQTDYVERVYEVQAMPVVKKPSIELPKSKDSKISQQELDEVSKTVKARRE